MTLEYREQILGALGKEELTSAQIRDRIFGSRSNNPILKDRIGRNLLVLRKYGLVMRIFREGLVKGEAKFRAANKRIVKRVLGSASTHLDAIRLQNAFHNKNPTADISIKDIKSSSGNVVKYNVIERIDV
jgi:hypothetical protein